MTPRPPLGPARAAALGLLAAGLAPAAAAQEPVPAGGWPGGPEAAAEALRRGAYEEAEAAYRAEIEAPGARLGLAEALRLTGRYREALEALESGEPVPARRLARARLHREMGETAPARRLLAALLAEPGGLPADLDLPARVELAELELTAGEREAALDRLDRVITDYNRAPPGALGAPALAAAGAAAARLGFRSTGLFRDALRVFDEAALLDPADPAPRLRAGNLLLEKFNTADALDSFTSVLERNPRHPGALLGVARVARQRGQAHPEGEDPLSAALAVSPGHPEAAAFRVRRLLETERAEEAIAAAEAALALLPEAPEPLAALGAAFFLADRGQRLAEVESRFRALRPGDPRFDLGLAEAAERGRRYREAAERARAAAALRPDSPAAARRLGLNLLRLGEMDEGRAVLRDAFRRDPFDALVKNTLDLLDELDGFRVLDLPPLTLVLPEAEADLLAPYVEEVAKEALAEFADRYGFRPEAGVRIELYDRSADFSVRTVGLAGIGAHGVCFGGTLAMESPSARPPGGYHWASTLWHELGHTITMGLTDNRIPRWFTEGLSQYEERRRFGDGVPAAFLAALRDDRLLPVGEMNEGFVRPKWPGQVGVSYYHASLVVEQIEADHGFPAILDMLRAFRRGASSAEAIETVLGAPVEALDTAVSARIEERFGRAAASLGPARGGGPGHGGGPPDPAPGARPVEEGAPPGLEALVEAAERSPDDFPSQLRAGAALFEAERDEEAAGRFRRAADLIPEYGGPNGPFRFLARIHRRAGRGPEAAGALRRHLARVPSAYEDWLLLAEIEREAGDHRAAAEALESALLAYPLFAEPHELLAEAAAAAADHRIEVRERRAALAADPPDRAEALFLLAAALRRSGDRPAARRRVLEALEIAPTYDRALRLLLDLRREG